MKTKSSKMNQSDIEAGNRLKAIWDRKAKKLHLTQDKAAEIMGMTQGAVSQYLLSKIRLNFSAVVQFAKMLEVEPKEIRDDLIGLNDLTETRSSVGQRPAVIDADTIESAQAALGAIARIWGVQGSDITAFINDPWRLAAAINGVLAVMSEGKKESNIVDFMEKITERIRSERKDVTDNGTDASINSNAKK